ncbi:hypothetical protein [Streptomyces sp. NPDC003660]
MPASTRKSAARVRASYTGENLTAAEAGIPRDHSIGLDACRPEQMDLRALCAYGYLNHGTDYDGPAGWGLAILSSYTIKVSPRFDHMTVITNVPHNVAGRLLRGPGGRSGLPGLRIEAHHGHGNYILRHLPTGARLVVTPSPSGKPVGAQRDSYIDALTTDVPLTSTEERQLADVPHMTSAARRLLAGMFSRITVRDPDDRWALGNWFYDPLERPIRQDHSHDWSRSLHGFGDNWELRWKFHPHPEDLISALTEPVIGIPGAKTLTTDGSPAVTLNGAMVRLHSRHA